MEKSYSDCKIPEIDGKEILETVMKMATKIGLTEEDVLCMLKEHNMLSENDVLFPKDERSETQQAIAGDL